MIILLSLFVFLLPLIVKTRFQKHIEENTYENKINDIMTYQFVIRGGFDIEL